MGDKRKRSDHKEKKGRKKAKKRVKKPKANKPTKAARILRNAGFMQGYGGGDPNNHVAPQQQQQRGPLNMFEDQMRLKQMDVAANYQKLQDER
jgi:hypothetical protein